MRFVDFLKATVLLSAGAATLLAALTLISLTRDLEPAAVYVAAGWWLVAALIGVWLGRRLRHVRPRPPQRGGQLGVGLAQPRGAAQRDEQDVRARHQACGRNEPPKPGVRTSWIGLRGEVFST